MSSRASRAAYRALLGLLPRELREQWGDEMEATFLDRLARVEGSVVDYARTWIRAACDVLAQAGRERLDGPGWRELAFATAGDTRHAVRGLRRSPGFAAAVVLSFALGIGGTSTVFAFADAILIRPLPHPEADRLVSLKHEAPGMDVLEAEQSDGTYLHYRAHSRTLEDIGTYYENVVNLSGVDGAAAERVPVAMATTTLFSVLGARPALGRLPTPDEDRQDGGSDEVEVLISYDFWQRRYGGDPAIVGAMIEANRAPRRVIGVLERGFAFPRPEIAIWYPEDPDPATARAVDMFKLGVGRLRPGFDAEDAERDLDRLIATLPEAFPDFTPELLARARMRAVVTPLQEEIVGGARRALWLLLGGMVFLMLIASANVANLLLVRAEHRRNDLAMRAALGAGGGRLTRYLATEGAVLVTLGAIGGLIAAAIGVDALRSLVPPGALPRLHDVEVGGRVIAFGASTAFLVALGLAWLPGLRAQPPRLATLLGGGGMTGTQSRARQRARRVLVTAQVALAATLLVGAALMLQSFRGLSDVHPGFEAEGLLTAEIALPYRGYQSYASAYHLWERLVDRVGALPGVSSVGAVSGLPLVPKPDYYNLALEVEERPGDSFAGIAYYQVTPGYHATMGIPVVAGRGLRPEGEDTERPVMLSAAAARRLFPSGEAVGRRIRRAVGPGPWLTVAGVVGDVPLSEIGGDPAELVYVPILETPVDRGIPSQVTLVVRAGVPPESLTPGLRRILSELDPHLPLSNVRTMQRIVGDAMARTTFTLLLLGLAAGSSLFLGMLGVYGVTSYAVRTRTQEIGLRVALGARSPDVQRMMLRESAALVLVGAALGAAASFAVGPLMRALLFEVRPTDAVSYAAAALLLLLCAILATWIPARRAANVDPIEALRCR